MDIKKFEKKAKEITQKHIAEIKAFLSAKKTETTNETTPNEVE